MHLILALNHSCDNLASLCQKQKVHIKVGADFQQMSQIYNSLRTRFEDVAVFMLLSLNDL